MQVQYFNFKRTPFWEGHSGTRNCMIMSSHEFALKMKIFAGKKNTADMNAHIFSFPPLFLVGFFFDRRASESPAPLINLPAYSKEKKEKRRRFFREKRGKRCGEWEICPGGLFLLHPSSLAVFLVLKEVFNFLFPPFSGKTNFRNGFVFSLPARDTF